MFSKEELKLLSSKQGMIRLMNAAKPDFQKVLKAVQYDKKLKKLQIELIKVQNWVNENEERLLIIVEGRDFAGKGGAISAFMEHLNPRSIRLVALGKPTETEEGQWYFQRFINHLPRKGEILFFDRSWYNRGVVEPVNGFCTNKEYLRFMKEVNHFERMLTEDGIRIVKLFFAVSKDEQHKRLEKIRSDPLKRWELTSVDERAQELWDVYTEYETRMFEHTNTGKNPWIIVDADDLSQAILVSAKHILSVVPYK
ncbi:MAG: polyphosphate kinase 2 [Bacteroidetes bacterium]|nr:polyphosphate kinase 2 [Bacteroidota bacterium]